MEVTQPSAYERRGRAPQVAQQRDLWVSGSRSATRLADHPGERVTIELRLADDLEPSLQVEVDVRLRPGLEIARHPRRVRAGCTHLHQGRPQPLALAFGARADRDEVPVRAVDGLVEGLR